MGAAERLGTEHTAVACHIHALEEELNSCLFHRSDSGYGLTEVSEELLAGAEAIERAYAPKAAASSEERTISGTVRIGTPDGPKASSWPQVHPGRAQRRGSTFWLRLKKFVGSYLALSSTRRW